MLRVPLRRQQSDRKDMRGGEYGSVNFASKSYSPETGHGTEMEPAHWRNSCKLVGDCEVIGRTWVLLSGMESLGFQQEHHGLLWYS